MNNALCLQLPITGMFGDDLRKYVIDKFSSYGLIKWNEPRFEETLHVDEIVQTCANLILMRQFQKATDFMLNEIYEHTQVLARVFGKTISDSTDVSYLFDELLLEDILSKEERNRLNVLQMALDGMDIEVHEYGKDLKMEETDYLAEFLEIIRSLLAKANVSVGFSTLETIEQYATVETATLWSSDQNVSIIISRASSSSPTLTYIITNTCNSSTIVWATPSQAKGTIVTVVQSN
jgi:hypothetical protein